MKNIKIMQVTKRLCGLETETLIFCFSHNIQSSKLETIMPIIVVF